MIVANVTEHSARLSPRPSVVPCVFVIDDAVRGALERSTVSEGWQVETVASAAALLAHPRPAGPSCVVLDATLPGGLEVQQRIAAERPDMAIVVITGRVDVAMAVQAMKAGAAEVLSKPLDADAVVSALQQSLARS